MENIRVEDAAEGYVELFHRLGIDYILCSPGSEYVPIWEHLARYNSENKKPYYLNIRHEGTALSMAKGYAMATGRGQVVLTHVLTGLLHGAMELKAAYTDNIPLLLIVGENWTHDKEIHGGSPGPHYLSFTELGGQQRLVQPYIKWLGTPRTNSNILHLIQRAYKIANTNPKGPVLITLPRELLFEKLKSMRFPENIPEKNPTATDHQSMKILAEHIRDAKNPLIYTRYLGRNPASTEFLVELAKVLGVPVFEIPGYMNFPTNNPLHLGTNMQQYLGKADLIFIIDASAWPPWYPPQSIRNLTQAKIIFLDLDPIQQKYPVYDYPSDMLIQGDSSIAIPKLTRMLRTMELDKKIIEERRKRWINEHKRLRNEWEKEALFSKNEEPIDPKWLSYCINESIDTNTIIVNETITHSDIIHRYIEKNRQKPATRFQSTGPMAHTGLGQGIGVALGAKLANPEKTVIALTGDGSFNYNPIPACFGASQEYNLPILIVIFNNQSYKSMKKHENFYPEGFSVKQGLYYGVPCTPKPNYGMLAEAYNGHAETIQDPKRVLNTLETGIELVKDGKLVLLDVLLKE